MKKVIAVLLMGIFVAACVPKQQTITLHNRFDADAVAFVKSKGSNTIKGSAFLKTRGGDVKTCAGNQVHLVPVTPYSTERVQAIYGTTYSGAKEIVEASRIKFSSDAPGYMEHRLETMCNQHGDFVFNQVPDGEYFLTTGIHWEVAAQYGTGLQGGVLMQRVTAEGGETKEIILSR